MRISNSKVQGKGNLINMLIIFVFFVYKLITIYYMYNTLHTKKRYPFARIDGSPPKSV